MEAVVAHPGLQNALQRRGVHLAAEGAGQPRTRVVDEYDEDVRRVGRKPPRRRSRAVDRLLHRAAGDAARRRGWKRQRVAPSCRGWESWLAVGPWCTHRVASKSMPSESTRARPRGARAEPE